jgi:Sulfotransferase family
MYLERPVILLGAPRSGTTILGNMLGQHRSLAFADEPRFVWRYGNDRKSDLLRREDARPEVCRHIRGYFSRFVRESGKTRLLEKTPSNALRPEFVDAILPGAIFLCILRDPLSNVLSIRDNWLAYAFGIRKIGTQRLARRMDELSLTRLPYYTREAVARLMPGPLSRMLGQNVWGPRLPGIRGLLRELTIIEIAALQWRTCVEATRHFGRQLPPERYHEVRLEELSSDVARRILALCSLDDDPAVERYFRQAFDFLRVHRRIPDEDPAEVQRALRWIEPTMSWLDQTLPPLAPAALSPGTAARD